MQKGGSSPMLLDSTDSDENLSDGVIDYTGLNGRKGKRQT